MSSVGVGTGHPDGEDRAMPHGDVLLAGSSLSVSGATNLPGISGFLEIAGYRSLVVAIVNNGVTDLTITPQWDWFNATSHVNATDSQTVKAGATKRMIFQNQGDILKRVRVTGGGAGDTVHYYVTGSNLDPLPSTSPDWLLLQGVLSNVTNPVVGDNDHGKFDATHIYTNDQSKWSFTLDAGGNIKEVLPQQSGLYQLFLQYKWAAAGAAYDRTTLINATPNVIETFNGIAFVGVSPDDRVTTAGVYDGSLAALCPVDSNGAIFNVQPVLAAAGNANFTPVFFWIVRHNLAG